MNIYPFIKDFKLVVGSAKNRTKKTPATFIFRAVLPTEGAMLKYNEDSSLSTHHNRYH